MIKEAADTLKTLKSAIERIGSGELDANSGWRIIRNNRQPNGIEMTPDIVRAREAFLAAASNLTSGGDLMAGALKDIATRAWETETAMSRLLEYRTALRSARGREDARIIGAVDETEVDDPF